MEKLWTGRTSGHTAVEADAFNRSIQVDRRMLKEDIAGSVAHATMLAAQGIITAAEGDAIRRGLKDILAEVERGSLPIDEQAEDIHTFVEAVLTARIGAAGKKLHTARSRNDQVATDLRLYLRGEADAIAAGLTGLIAALTDQAARHKETIMPAYTHLQRAQPVSFGHYLLAYAMMLIRDAGRLRDCRVRLNVSPLGSAALAGTTYPIDRRMTAGLLGFGGICENSLDAVSDRDFVIELTGVIAIIMLHLSRLAEEIILWCSWEFRFIELDEAYTTGSSIMPQKKNPDMAELVRGKAGRVFGDLTAILTVLKGLPLAYNKDMQEDKEIVIDACDTVKASLDIFSGMVATLTVNEARMRQAAAEGFINATDLADYLVGKGLPFRDAYKMAGSIVSTCLAEGSTLERLPLDRYRAVSPLFEADVFEAIDLRRCVERRVSEGGTSGASVDSQIGFVRAWLGGEGGARA